MLVKKVFTHKFGSCIHEHAHVLLFSCTMYIGIDGQLESEINTNERNLVSDVIGLLYYTQQCHLA